MCGHQSQTSLFQLTPFGGILEKMFRLNRNRCQSCQQRQITDEPIGRRAISYNVGLDAVCHGFSRLGNGSAHHHHLSKYTKTSFVAHRQSEIMMVSEQSVIYDSSSREYNYQ